MPANWNQIFVASKFVRSTNELTGGLVSDAQGEQMNGYRWMTA